MRGALRKQAAKEEQGVESLFDPHEIGRRGRRTGAAIVGLAACVSTPVANEKIAVAQASVQHAEQSGAPRLARVELSAARDKLQRAERAAASHETARDDAGRAGQRGCATRGSDRAGAPLARSGHAARRKPAGFEAGVGARRARTARGSAASQRATARGAAASQR